MYIYMHRQILVFNVGDFSNSRHTVDEHLEQNWHLLVHFLISTKCLDKCRLCRGEKERYDMANRICISTLLSLA